MACVFGEMRTLKTSERWGAQMYVGQVARNSSPTGVVSADLGECPSYPLCRVQPIAFHQSRPPVYSPSLNDPCTRCLSQPTTSSHCLALTLSRSTRSHTVSLYLVLTLSHVRFRTSCHMVSSSVNVSHRLALFRIHLTVCHATGQFNAPTLSHAHFDPPFNAQVTRTVAAPTVAAHTLLRQPQLHY